MLSKLLEQFARRKSPVRFSAVLPPFNISIMVNFKIFHHLDDHDQDGHHQDIKHDQDGHCNVSAPGQLLQLVKSEPELGRRVSKPMHIPAHHHHHQDQYDDVGDDAGDASDDGDILLGSYTAMSRAKKSASFPNWPRAWMSTHSPSSNLRNQSI